MFNFIKKSTVLAGGDGGGCEERDGEKERRKREKKERKEREKRERIAAGLEEPLRLEEVRRSLKLRGRRKDKEKLPSGITADYTASLFAHLEQDSNYSNYPLIPTSGSNSNLSDENNHLSPGYPTTHSWTKKEGVLQSDSSETSLNSLNNPNNANSPRQPPNLPPIPPRPPKRGILKGPRLSNTSSNSQESNVQSTDTVDFINGQDPNVLARNTQQNEVISYGIPPSKSTSSSDDMQQLQNFTKKVIHSPVETQYKNYKNNSNNPSIVTQDVDEMPKTNGNSYIGVTSTSPSADSLTDTTTNSSFATPPFSTSPVGESQGFHRWSRTSNFEDVYLPLPSLTPLVLPKPRVLTIQRQKSPRNDFGFSLRRAMVQERVFIGDIKDLNGHEENGLLNGDNKCNGNISNGLISKLTHKAVILAEPGSYPGASETGLLPGDRLIEVNGVNVEGKTREDVIDLIKSSQDSVTIKVQPIAELCELSRRRAADGGNDVELADSNVRGGTLSRSGSRRFTSSQAKSEEQLACEKEWLQTGHMWLAHRGGFTAVVREGDADAGRAKVRVIQTGEVLTVDEDDLEKANPPQLERCEDIATLRCLNECGALHVLRSRHAAGLPHARAGHALLVMGPPRRTAPVYTEKVAAMFRGCRADDMPPHVFAAAQAAHRSMLASRRDRAIVFLGRSGSGKTSAMRHSVWYLASAYPAQNSKLTPEKFDAAFDVLHTFGSCLTSSNSHASRFVSLTSLDFDGGGALVSASVQTLLPDLRPGQTPLRAIHNLFHGCDGRLRRELLLDQAPLNAPNPFIGASEKADAPTDFSALKEALQLLGVTEPEQLAVWKILAAICHLGWAGAVKATTTSGLKYQFASTGCGQRAARLLGVAAEELARAVFAGAAPSSPQSANNLRTPSPSNEREISGTEALDAFVTGLYNETFNIVAALVNRSLSTSSRTSASILLLDTPGADNPMCAGQQSGAPLSKLLSNYLQERLQAVFYDAMLVAPRERYAQEGITLDDGAEEDWLSETVNPGPMVELLDKAPQNTIVRSSQADLRECDRRGLLWLLDEESMYPGSSDDTFLERVMAHYGAPNQTQYLIKKAPHARQFILQHLQGTNPVLYDVTGWVKASRESPVTKKALTLLQESQNEDVGRLSSWARGACGVGAWSAAVGDASTLRRASSIRRTLTSGTAGMKRRSTALQAKFVADGVVDTLRRCGSGGVQFVCCLLTNQPAEAPDDVNVPLLRSQFRGFQLLDAARLYKQGFPEHMPLSEFARRYRLLATSESEESDSQQASLSDRQVVDDMLLALDLDVTSYRLGLTQRGVAAHTHAARREARAPPRSATATARAARDMPAVKVFNIFGGQKPAEKQPAPPPAHAPMQKFYRTFSVGPETSPEHKGTKVTAIAACLEKKISDPPNDNVKFSKNSVSVNDKTDVSVRQHVYENVNIPSVDGDVQNDKLLDETKGYSSIYENIVVVGKPAAANGEVAAESKLNKALESFDKILSEFSVSASLTPDVTNNSFIVPKLQKSKTCSIIESRCILKKANSDPHSNGKTRSKVARNNSIDKTTSLWNLDDMKGKELTSPLMPLTATVGDKMNPDKYATYKISSKNSSRVNCIKTEDLKKLDVKTRILKKTLSNPPSTPVPVISKTKPVTKKVEKKLIDPKKVKTKICADNGSNIKMAFENKEAPKSQMQKAKSVWEIGNEVMISPGLERTKSTTSIAGSPSKIPVIRSQMSHNKFSSTRALFSPTPVDLNNVEQPRECAQKKKLTALRKNAEKPEPNKQIRQKSQINLKSDEPHKQIRQKSQLSFKSDEPIKQIRQKSQLSLKADSKRQVDKPRKDSVDPKKTISPKSSLRDYSEEINAVRAKMQQRKINKRDIVISASEMKRNENETDEIDSSLTPVKSIVKKLELKTARETKSDTAQFVSCKVIPPVHKELCVANTTFHNHLSTLVGRQIKYVESRDDAKTCSQDKKLELHKHADEKISDTHSDCSDDSGHVSNDAANDNDPAFDNVHDLSPVHSSIDEVDCKIFDGPKQFGIDLSENAKTVCPVRPARRNGRANEVASGTRATDAPKVDEQIMFRGGVVGGLDARRDAALARVLVRLQARARGLLARRRAQRLRTQHTAARCVQRNVRAFLAVRDWPWWRLLVRVTPLLAVHRTEHRLKQAQEELETLRAKLDKTENERTHFKNETEKLETKVR